MVRDGVPVSLMVFDEPLVTVSVLGGGTLPLLFNCPGGIVELELGDTTWGEAELGAEEAESVGGSLGLDEIARMEDGAGDEGEMDEVATLLFGGSAVELAGDEGVTGELGETSMLEEELNKKEELETTDDEGVDEVGRVVDEAYKLEETVDVRGLGDDEIEGDEDDEDRIWEVEGTNNDEDTEELEEATEVGITDELDSSVVLVGINGLETEDEAGILDAEKGGCEVGDCESGKVSVDEGT